MTDIVKSLLFKHDVSWIGKKKKKTLRTTHTQNHAYQITCITNRKKDKKKERKRKR